MNILITGCGGFSGSHLCEYLLNLNENHAIYGTIRGRCRQTTFIDKIKENLILLECDLTDYNSIQATIEESQPDIIFHLAAMSFVPTSWRAPQETFNTNALGTINLLEVVRKSQFNPKIQICGSSEEYGKVNTEDIPIKETCQLNPLSPYAVSKVMQDLSGYQYHMNYGMKIIRTRAFNLIGPRSGEKIVSANFAKQIASMKSDYEKPLLVGDISSIRDFNDVRDIVRAYWLAINKCDYGDIYNIATGIGHRISEIVDIYSRISSIKFAIKQDKSKLRPTDVTVLIGDSSKFREKTGWEPQISFETSLQDVLSYWRNQI
ncbi:MAG: GDP-mannose 4,6-dehydratase [Actinobacteria bacterium]|nr:GDP-mannose 4,6-dehydratase [Actinomycetota bacterium]MBE3114622.1 GDP-mannose 4,6-dehydratase [Actinomycetota bacterium]